MKPTVKLVIFDAEGTFIKIHPPVGEYYAQLFKEVGINLNPVELQSRVKEVYRLVFNENGANHRWNQALCFKAWRSFFEILFKDYRFEPWFDSLFEKAYAHFGSKDCAIPIPGFPEFAKALRAKGLKLCVLSNWDGRLHSVLSGLGLDKLFDKVYTGCEIGYLKPNLASFLHVLSDFKVKPEEAVMIGDSLKDDIEPALKLGMKAIHYQGEDYQDLFLTFQEQILRP
ncbi:MAG: HAD family hydrolase [Thermodesulfobacterium sp.]|nr:HAD family hydrolase [Thermodesulfobacterium sp.]